MRAKRYEEAPNFPWFLVSVIVIIIVLLILYSAADTSKISSCENDSECIPYRVSQDPGEYICAKKKINTSLEEKVLIFKYSQEHGIDEKPNACSCKEGICSPIKD